MSSLQYFAKGGCFLAGTLIGTPSGDVSVETLRANDKVISFNETTKQLEDATIGGVDVLERDHFYIINGIVKVTAEHPFYTTKGIKDVKDLHIGDKLIGRYDTEVEIGSIKVIYEEVTVYNLLDVTPNHNYYAGNFLVHNKGGGGHASSSHTSSSRSSGSSSKSTSKSTTSSKAGTSKAKPGSTIKTADGKVVKSSTAKPVNKTFTQSKGIVGDNGYSPRFTNGYQAPAGSVVYYRDTGFIDYLPWIYIFGHSNANPQNQQATVVQPDGKQVVAKPEAGGTDGMLILNWIILIIVVGAIVAGLVALVNKLSNRGK